MQQDIGLLLLLLCTITVPPAVSGLTHWSIDPNQATLITVLKLSPARYLAICARNDGALLILTLSSGGTIANRTAIFSESTMRFRDALATPDGGLLVFGQIVTTHTETVIGKPVLPLGMMRLDSGLGKVWERTYSDNQPLERWQQRISCDGTSRRCAVAVDMFFTMSIMGFDYGNGSIIMNVTVPDCTSMGNYSWLATRRKSWCTSRPTQSFPCPTESSPYRQPLHRLLTSRNSQEPTCFPLPAHMIPA